MIGNAASAFGEDTAIHGKLMARWGELEYVAGDYTKAQALLEASLSLLRQFGLRSEIAFVLYRPVLIGLGSGA